MINAQASQTAAWRWLEEENGEAGTGKKAGHLLLPRPVKLSS